MIRQSTNEIRTIGRNTQGVRLIRLDEGAKISSVAKVVKEDEEEEDSLSPETDDSSLKHKKVLQNTKAIRQRPES